MNRPADAGGAPTQVRFAVIELSRLRPHEQFREELLRRLLDRIRIDGVVRKPVLVEAEHLVILDGHHRVEALRLLGCKRVPVYLVDYDDGSIGLTTWPGAVVPTVTKAEVVDHGLRGDLFPPKTTRHLVTVSLDEVRVPLDDLR